MLLANDRLSMTKPTEILSAEHRIIEQVLDCLERIALSATESGRLDGASATQALEFFRQFADRCHHGKEEVHLFPAMEARGFLRQSGPTGVMLLEHDQGRAFIRGMAGALEEAAAGHRPAVSEFAAHAEGYVELLRAHIEKEDHCLFSMANQVLSDEDQQELLAAFHRVEHEDMEAGAHEHFIAVANELADRFGVTRATIPAAGRCGCAVGLAR